MPSLTRAKSTGTYSNPAAVMQSPMRPSTCSTLLASWSMDSPNSSEPKLGFPPEASEPEPEPPPHAAETLMPAASPKAPRARGDILMGRASGSALNTT